MKQKRSKDGRRAKRGVVQVVNGIVTVTYSDKSAGVKLEIIPATRSNKKEG